MANAMDFLKKAAKAPAAPSKKKGVPVLDLPSTDENKKALQTLIEQKQAEKTAEGLRKQSEQLLRPQAEKVREDYCGAENEFHSSVKVKCGDVGPVTFVNQCRYSKIPNDQEGELKEVFGENYEKCFSQVTEITLTDKAMKEIDGLLPKLMEAVGGADKFTEYFGVAQHITPTEYMHEHRVLLDPKIREASKKAIEAGLVKPVTPSFTV